MKWFYLSVILFDGFMIWYCADMMFRCLNEGKTGLAALNLLGVIAWVLMLADNKKEIEKEQEKEKKVEKNLED